MLGQDGRSHGLLTVVAVAAPAIGLFLYVLTHDAGATPVIGVLMVVIISAALVVTAGAFLGIDQPKVAPWLLWAWTPAVLIVVGAIAAIGIHLGVEWAAGKDATGQEKGVATAAGVLVTAVVTQVRGWLEKHLAPWISAKVVCRRYGPLFPCTPEGLGKGRQAQEAFSTRCRDRKPENWSVPKTRELLNSISEAVAADEVSGGRNWKCLEPS